MLINHQNSAVVWLSYVQTAVRFEPEISPQCSSARIEINHGHVQAKNQSVGKDTSFEPVEQERITQSPILGL
jgi:hypothetical protein